MKKKERPTTYKELVEDYFNEIRGLIGDAENNFNVGDYLESTHNLMAARYLLTILEDLIFDNAIKKRSNKLKEEWEKLK